MLEAQQDYSCLGLLGAILGVKGVRVVDGVLGFFAFGRWNNFPGQDPTGLENSCSAVGVLELVVVEAFANGFILDEGVHFLGLGSCEERAVRSEG